MSEFASESKGKHPYFALGRASSYNATESIVINYRNVERLDDTF